MLKLFFDTRLSEPTGQSCASCHDPSRAFTGNNGTTIGVALGSRPGTFGTRDTPTAMYLATAPRFGSIVKEGQHVPAVGMFWDGRADTLEDQAKGPFFNPLEMNNADTPALIATTTLRSMTWGFASAHPCPANPRSKAKHNAASSKTPTLRNIAKTAPYMHNGVFDNLRDVVAYMSRAIPIPSRGIPTARNSTTYRRFSTATSMWKPRRINAGRGSALS